MTKTYYSMETKGNEANINIYGDIASYAWEAMGEFSSNMLSKKLAEIGEVSKINVYINSYGGEVAEGLAIYNALKRHKAKVVTYCDGFACSIASVIFMAGDERIMNSSSLLMIHNAWSYAVGNAEELRKQAEDLEKITKASLTAYKEHSSLSEEEIKKLMDEETWLLPEEALEHGFCTSVEKTESKAASQNAKMILLNIVKQRKQKDEEEEEETDEEEKPTPEDTEDTDETTDDDTDDKTDDETKDDETDEDEEEKPPEKKDEDGNAEQRISKFFSAILKM